MNLPATILHGGVETLSPAEIRLEVRDLLITALRRCKVAQNKAQAVDYKLDMYGDESVHATC